MQRLRSLHGKERRSKAVFTLEEGRLGLYTFGLQFFSLSTNWDPSIMSVIRESGTLL